MKKLLILILLSFSSILCAQQTLLDAIYKNDIFLAKAILAKEPLSAEQRAAVLPVALAQVAHYHERLLDVKHGFGESVKKMIGFVLLAKGGQKVSFYAHYLRDGHCYWHAQDTVSYNRRYTDILLLLVAAYAAFKGGQILLQDDENRVMIHLIKAQEIYKLLAATQAK